MKITVWTLASHDDGTVENSIYASEAEMHLEFWARIKRAMQWRDDEIAELKHYAGDDLDEGYSEACNEYGMEITMTWGAMEIDVPDAPQRAYTFPFPPPVSEETTRAPGTLPPDPDDQNDDRAEWAEQALERFQAITGTDDGDAIGDLIADLKHLCDRKPELYGDFATGLKRGLSHYEAETMPFEVEEEESANA